MSTWIYRSDNGEFSHDGTLACVGYSGWEQGRNSPEYEALHDIGPIPRGRYRVGQPYHHPRLGPLTFNLTPEGHDAHGRTDFRIHGDNKTNDASHGCIVAYKFARMALAFDVTQNSEPVYVEVV